MKVAISLKIDVSKIDKSRLFKGEKGTYLDATVFIDVGQKDQYENNGMITQDVTKDERQQGVKGNILGNVKVFWKDAGNQNNQVPQRQQRPQMAPAPQSYGTPPPNRPAPQHQQQAPVMNQQQPTQYAQPQNDFSDDVPF